MKAFVIKNKEGKYYDCWALGFTETINECAIYQDRQTAENDIRNCIKDNEYLGYKDDCEVVEITIAEGDLEQENLQLKEQLDLCLNPEDFINQIRKQVCDEIRESCKKYLDIDLSDINDCHHRNLPAVILAEILDKIEQAKE